MNVDRRTFLQIVSSSALLAGALPTRIFTAEKLGKLADASGKPDFAIRGFEFCGTGMWQWKSIDRALDIMEHLGFNTLIVHQNDLPDFIVWPHAYFPTDFMYARNPVRTVLTCNGRNHLREVVRRAARKNIQVLLEAKEIGYPDGLIELHPELMEIKGVVCPTHPFWWGYERERYAEVLKEVPGLAGIMISAGTRESKVSIAARTCTCERCRSYDPATWYTNLIRSIHEPLQAEKKLLVVRDFAYSRAEQNLVVDACSKVSKDVVVSLKNTPHDFYPVFPDNPRIGNTGGNPQWVEFDTIGQYSGMGVFPVSLVEDMQKRLRHCRKQGATGVWFRADVEFVSDSSVFNSPNILNMFGASLLSGAVEQDLGNVYRAWLAYGLLDPMKTESEQPDPVPMAAAEMERYKDFMTASWSVIEKTLYVRGLVFTDGTGQFPDSVDRAFDNMLVLHQRDDWEPGASKRVELTDENLKAIFEEKEQAEREVAQLPKILQLEQSQLPAELRASLETMLDLYQRYVQGYKRCTVACFTIKKAEQSRATADIAAAERAAGQLAAYRQETASRLKGIRIPHYVHRLFALGPLDRLTTDIHKKVAVIQAIGTPAANRT